MQQDVFTASHDRQTVKLFSLSPKLAMGPVEYQIALSILSQLSPRLWDSATAMYIQDSASAIAINAVVDCCLQLTTLALRKLLDGANT